MNVFRKIYCRTYQIGLRTVLPILPYREPELINGITGVPEVLKKENADSILLVTDKGIRGLGLTKPLEELLEASKVKCTVYDDVVANPTVANVEAALSLYKQENCKGLIAFGGGSSMDCAKGVGARLAKPNMTLEQMKGILKIRKKLPLLIALPTTAGTGSETTISAVITDDKTHHKYPINDFSLIPKYAVLEPEVTVGLPPMLTATTGMDALTHAVEAYIGRSTTKGTRKASIDATKLIFDNLEVVYNDGHNLEARRNMLHAAYLAGTAFTKSYVGYVHAVAHSLGGKYGTAHGLANSVLLPPVLEYYGTSAEKKLAGLAKEVSLVPADMDMHDAAKAFIAKIYEMNKQMGIPTTIDAIREEDIAELAGYADKEANPLYPVPKLMNAKELQNLYRLVM